VSLGEHAFEFLQIPSFLENFVEIQSSHSRRKGWKSRIVVTLRCAALADIDVSIEVRLMNKRLAALGRSLQSVAQ
jgi:hypothetical protein